MDVICKKDKYRVIKSLYDNYNRNACNLLTYKVQVKCLFFWTTIAEFKEFEYDIDPEFCEQEAIELFDKIINPYGRI